MICIIMCCSLIKCFIFEPSMPFVNLSLQSQTGAQWLSGRVLDLRPRGHRFEPHQCHCVVSLSKNFNPSLALVQPRKTRPSKTERFLMGRKESNQTNKQIVTNTSKIVEIAVFFTGKKTYTI